MAIPFLKGIDVAGTADLSNLTIDGAQGTDGQVLTSTGSGVAWENPTGTIDGSGSANKVAFWTDADTLSFDSKLHWDSTNDRLGINKTDPNAKLHIVTGNNDQQHSVTISHTRNDSNVGTQALKVDANFSGADTTTADRTNAGLYVDLDSSADGDASHEVRSYGIWVDARITGFNDILRGGFFNVESNNQDEKTAEIVGVYGSATHDSSSTNGGVSNMYGARGVANIQDYGDIDNTYAVHGLVQIANNRNANVDNAHAIYGEIQIDEADALTYGNMYGARIVIDNNEGSVPNFSNQYLFFGDYQGTEATGSYGLYIDGSRHYLANKLGIGVTNPSEALDVSGNANVSGTISTDSDGSSTNWKQAYDNHITGVAVTGTSTKTITLTQRDGGTITTTFTDQTGSGLTMTNGVDNRLVTASGIASINGESGLLFGGSSLEVTPGDITTPLHVKRTSASTRQVNLLLHANDGSSTSEGFLGCDSSSNLRWGGSGNTSLNSLILTEDNLDFVVSSSTNNAIVRLAGGGTNFANFSIGGAAGAITVNSGTNSITIGHHDTSSASSVDNSGNTVIQDVTLDTYGHVTGLSSKTLTIPSVYNGTLTVQGTGALGGSGTFTANQSTNATISISHDDTSSQSSVDNSNGNVIQDVTLDTYGHVTALGSVNLDNRYYQKSTSDSRYVNVTGDTITSGTNIGLTINHDTFEQGLVLTRNHASNAPSILFKNNSGTIGTLFAIASDDNPYWRFAGNATNYKIWHAGNDGSGSGLDADLLDGQNGSYYLDYNNFSNTPSIPTVNNATLTVQGTGALGGSGTFTANQAINSTISISHDDTSSQSSVNNSSGTVIQDVTLDGYGHVTGLGSTNLDNRYVLKAGGTFEGDITIEGAIQVDDGFSSDGVSPFYSWRALQNTASSSNQYYRIARIYSSQSSRFIIELAGRSTSYGDTALPAFGKIVGQLNNDNNYDIVYYNASATDEVVDEVGQVDVDTARTDIYVRVGQFSELTATAHISDGSITTYDSNSGSTSAPTGYVQATEYKLWNTGNDGSGSGLDADTLDGQHASAFLTAHPNISAASSSNNSGRTYIQDITLDSNGHVTGIATATETVTNTNTNYYLNGISKSGNTLTFSVSGATNQTYTFGSNAFNSTTIPTNNNQLTNGAGYLTAHPNISAASSSNNSGNTFIQDITLDSNGHITGIATATASGGGGDADTVDGFHADRFFRRIARANATVGGGWMTVAENTSGRRAGEIIVTDADSGDHSYIRIHWVRSYTDSTFTVLNTGGHSNRITGVRVMRDSDSTYGNKKLQVYVTTSSNYEVNIYEQGDIVDYTSHTVVTPVIQNSISGYTVQGSSFTELDDYPFTVEQGVQSSKLKGGIVEISGDDILFNNGYGNPKIDTYYGSLNISLGGTSAGVVYVGTGSGNASGSLYATTIGGGSNTKVVYSTSAHKYYVGSSTEEMRLESDGDLHVEGDVTAYSTTVSDIRLKDNVVTIDNALDKVCKLRGVEYTWNKGSRKDTRDLGVIAQEVEKVLPEIVKEKKMPLIDDSDTTYKSVDYEKITAVLVEAVKEQQAQIDELTTILEEVTKQLNNGNNV